MHFSIPSLLESYGYIVLFLLVGLESLGIPLPGETGLLTAGALAALGHLSIEVVIPTAAAGAIVGDNAGYWIGREGGLPLVRRIGRLVHVNDAKLARVHAFFEHHGPKAVFLGRFIALLRTWAALLAGVGRMGYGTFTLYNALGGIVWSAVVGMLGYLFGKNLPRLEHYVSRTSWVVALVVVVAATMLLLRRRLRHRLRG
jgi:membrane protein DedA with SNARE-associated domain